jgi:hypothetical protein
VESASWGLAFFVMYAPTVFELIFLVAAGILFAKVRSPASGFFFFGFLVLALAPLAFMLIGGTGVQSVRPVVMVLALMAQVLGFLFYVLSVPKRQH